MSFDPHGHADLAPRSTSFEFEPGQPSVSVWPRATTRWLARDLNHNGRLDSGRELFGSFTLTAHGRARDGFEALAALDDTGDGVVDAHDVAFSELALWNDDEARFVALTEVGVTAVRTDATPTRHCDQHGTCEILRGSFAWVDREGKPHVGATIDVTLRLANAPTAFADRSARR